MWPKDIYIQLPKSNNEGNRSLTLYSLCTTDTEINFTLYIDYITIFGVNYRVKTHELWTEVMNS